MYICMYIYKINIYIYIYICLIDFIMAYRFYMCHFYTNQK